MYTPLYIKTNNSLLDSLIKIDELIDYAKKNNIKNLTITDNNMYGVMDFYHACINNGIKPIIGLETKYKDNIVILYAKNYDGYLELVKIVSNDYKPTKSDNLICIVPYKSLSIYKELKDLYLTYIGYDDITSRTKLDGDNLVYMNEILCLTKDEEQYLKYLYGIKNSKVLMAIDQTFNNKYLHLEEEVNKNYGYDIKNNYKITQMCNVEIKFNNDLLPIYPCPNNDSFVYLKQLCIEGVKKIFGNTINKEYQDRLKYELDIINKMGFCNYFLVVWDYVKYAKDNGILVGTGRGSAAGSLVAYVLNITTVDPIKYNLLFERFLNPERVTMPDIDVDFEDTRRNEVVNYCIKKYGIKKVVPIIAFGTLGAKQAIRDVSRVIDIDLKTVDILCKKINSKLSLKENLSNVKDILNYNPELKDMYKVAIKLEGLKRHTTTHAAGVVISNKNLDEIIPLAKNHELYITGYDMTYLEEIGLLKMDFLALRNLTLINNILNDIDNLNFDTIPLEDKEALKVFTDVNTLGIFQFESDGMMNFLRKLKPVTFTDVYNALALYRPGPMGSIDTFIKRRQGSEPITYLDPSLEPYLKDTYGIMIYQEQIMQIARLVANYSLGEADILRRAMSKKKEDVLLKERERFIYKSIENGYDEDKANKIYDLIFKFASYGFNKSHSVVYAFVAYKMAYLKAHYPNIFLSHLLTMVMGDDKKTKQYIYECRKYNVKMLNPSINKSDALYIIEGNNIRFPLSNIKGISSSIASIIKEERQKGHFIDIYNFFERCKLSKKNLESLILVGVFDEFGYTRKTLIDNLDVLLNYGEVASMTYQDYDMRPLLTLKDEYCKKELMLNEYELLGFYLTNHPVTEYRNNENTISIDDVPSYFDKYVRIIVLVDRINVTKNIKPTCFITGSDELNIIDLVLFNNVYEQNKDITKGDVILVEGKVEKRFDKYQIIVNKVKVLN